MCSIHVDDVESVSTKGEVSLRKDSDVGLRGPAVGHEGRVDVGDVRSVEVVGRHGIPSQARRLTHGNDLYAGP